MPVSGDAPSLRFDFSASNGITLFKKMGKFPKQPELKRTIKKWEKFLTGKHEMIGVMLRYTLSRHQSPPKKITDEE